MNKRDKISAQAAFNSRKYAARHTFYYRGVDGRGYLAEKREEPLEPRGKVMIALRHNEKVSAKQVFDLEHFCGEPVRSWNAKQTMRVVREYGLSKDETKNLWTGDPEAVFARFLEKYEKAGRYKSYKAMLYAMRYGDAPCVTYKEGEQTE